MVIDGSGWLVGKGRGRGREEEDWVTSGYWGVPAAGSPCASSAMPELPPPLLARALLHCQSGLQEVRRSQYAPVDKCSKSYAYLSECGVVQGPTCPGAVERWRKATFLLQVLAPMPTGKAEV